MCVWRRITRKWERERERECECVQGRLCEWGGEVLGKYQSRKCSTDWRMKQTWRDRVERVVLWHIRCWSDWAMTVRKRERERWVIERERVHVWKRNGVNGRLIRCRESDRKSIDFLNLNRGHSLFNHCNQIWLPVIETSRFAEPANDGLYGLHARMCLSSNHFF